MRFEITGKNHEFWPLPSATDYLRALRQNPSYTKLLDISNKPYAKLITWLLENETMLADEDATTLSIKELAVLTEVEYSKLSKQLKTIYSDINQLNMDCPYKFVGENQKLCALGFEYMGQYCGFNVGIDIMPRIGEHFQFDFITPLSGGSHFVVQRVYHGIENGKQQFSLSLSTEQSGPYLKLLKEKAFLNGAISYEQYNKPMNLTLERELVACM
jgi:hypothetical protein